MEDIPVFYKSNGTSNYGHVVRPPVLTIQFEIIEDEPDFEIVSPVNEHIFYISEIPEMPDSVFCKIKKNSPLSDQDIDWKCKINYECTTRNSGSIESSMTKNYEESTEGFIWDLGDQIIGGDMTITANVTVNDSTYCDTVLCFIRGQNPETNTIRNRIDNELEAILMVEHGQDREWLQFTRELYDVPEDNLPLQSDWDNGTGWGICQVDEASGTNVITTSVLWDWTGNINGGTEYWFNH